jgi:hypothetical protein
VNENNEREKRTNVFVHVTTCLNVGRGKVRDRKRINIRAIMFTCRSVDLCALFDEFKSRY